MTATSNGMQHRNATRGWNSPPLLPALPPYPSAMTMDREQTESIRADNDRENPGKAKDAKVEKTVKVSSAL